MTFTKVRKHLFSNSQDNDTPSSNGSIIKVHSNPFSHYLNIANAIILFLIVKIFLKNIAPYNLPT